MINIWKEATTLYLATIENGQRHCITMRNKKPYAHQRGHAAFKQILERNPDTPVQFNYLSADVGLNLFNSPQPAFVSETSSFMTIYRCDTGAQTNIPTAIYVDDVNEYIKNKYC